MSAKGLVLLLGLLIALFFLSMMLGPGSGDQSVGGVAEAVVDLVRGFRKEDPLTLADLAGTTPAACQEQLRRGRFTLAEGQSCRLEVGDASAPVRTLTLRLQRGRQAALRLMTGGEGGRTQTQELPTSADERQLTLQFVSEGGTLNIACRRGAGPQAQCLLDVL